MSFEDKLNRGTNIKIHSVKLLLTLVFCQASESRGNIAFCVGVYVCRVEGRTWYTSHRGRLWIAAAAKKPTPQEIAEVEAMYRHIYKKGTQTVHSKSENKTVNTDGDFHPAV